MYGVYIELAKTIYVRCIYRIGQNHICTVIYRIGQNHICMVYIYNWPKPYMYGVYIELANTIYVRCICVYIELAKTIYVRCVYTVFLQTFQQTYGHNWRTYAVLADPSYVAYSGWS